MTLLTVLLPLAWILCFFALIIGLIRPSLVLKNNDKLSRGRVFKLYGSMLFVLFIAVGMVAPDEKASRPSNTQSSPQSNTNSRDSSVLHSLLSGNGKTAFTKSPAPLSSVKDIEAYAISFFEDATERSVNWDNRPRKVIFAKATKLANKQFKLAIQFRVSDNFSSNLVRVGILKDMMDFLEKATTDKGLEYVQRFQFEGVYPTQDKYGNSKTSVVVTASISRSLMRKINWENIITKDFERLLKSEGQLRIR